MVYSLFRSCVEDSHSQFAFQSDLPSQKEIKPETFFHLKHEPRSGRVLSKLVYNRHRKLLANTIQDIRSLRAIRDEYSTHSFLETEAYDEKVSVIVANFAFDMSLARQKSSQMLSNLHVKFQRALHQSAHDFAWHETEIVANLHANAVSFDYPKVVPLDQNTVKTKDSYFFTDNTIINPKTRCVLAQLCLEQKSFKMSSFSINYGYAVNTDFGHVSRYTISVDNTEVVWIQFADKMLDFRDNYRAHVARMPIIKNQNSSCNYFPNAQYVIEKMNVVADQIVKGEFSTQDEAIELLLDYKILTCLTFAIEDMHGTQFMNTVKMNYLVDYVRQNYPDRINRNLKIPHVHSDRSLGAVVNQSPEVAVVLKDPQTFRALEKKQIERVIQPLNYHYLIG